MAYYELNSNDELSTVIRKCNSNFRLFDNEGTINGNGGIIVESNYDNLSNKPSINGVTLTEDKSFADLGLEIGLSSKNTSVLTTAVNQTNVVHGISGFDSSKHVLLVFLEDKPQIRGIDYTIPNNNKITMTTPIPNSGTSVKFIAISASIV